MQIRQATVKFRAGKVSQTQYGERQNIVVSYGNGEESKLWFRAGRQPHCSLQKGQAIQVAIERRDGKEVKKLVESDVSEPSAASDASPSPTPEAPATEQQKGYVPLSNEQKREIASYVQEQAKLYSFCLQQAVPLAREMDGDLEDARAIATTLFISAQRKFGL